MGSHTSRPIRAKVASTPRMARTGPLKTTTRKPIIARAHNLRNQLKRIVELSTLLLRLGSKFKWIGDEANDNASFLLIIFVLVHSFFTKFGGKVKSR
jgi:hypothetical protein